MTRCRALVFAAILAACVGCDHAAKHVAAATLAGGTSLSLLGDTLRLELVQNSGAFLSVGSCLPPGVRSLFLVALLPALLVLALALAVRSGLASGWPLLGLGLVAGGGLGNWLDRLLHTGAVTDFVSLGVGPLRTGIFNVADVCIVAGVALLLLARWSGGRPEGATP